MKFRVEYIGILVALIAASFFLFCPVASKANEEPLINPTAVELYTAFAKFVIVGEKDKAEVVKNPNKTWKDINVKFPPITLSLKDGSTDDLKKGMIIGCNQSGSFKLFVQGFNGDSEKALQLCVKLREDLK